MGNAGRRAYAGLAFWEELIDELMARRCLAALSGSDGHHRPDLREDRADAGRATGHNGTSGTPPNRLTQPG